ncbi:radical SAM protein [Candidatus Bathyarchaeota archaeon]|nr:MAG: radical SAM protein [Candidatus Bathyarchaeota archaeon]
MTKRSGGINFVRVSLGSSIILGLTRGIIDAEPTTVYLLTYHEGRCSANCGFCPQARESRGRTDMLSRVTWPVFPLGDVAKRIDVAFRNRKVRRVCIQALNYKGVFRDIVEIVNVIRKGSEIPISVSCQPLKRDEMKFLRELGVERVSIALDAATEKIFRWVKGEEARGPYRWKSHIESLRVATEIFGRNYVTTHIIIGLGETEEESVKIMQLCYDMGVYPALFAFTPIPGTRLEDWPRPDIRSYRRIQVAHYLITRGIIRYEDVTFFDGRILRFGIANELLLKIVRSGVPFLTTGCPGCNRPYYNERPGGQIYNYPRRPRPDEISKILEEMDIEQVLY